MEETGNETEPNFARWVAPPRAFLALSLIFGTILVILTPPFQAADEPFHFMRAFQVSEGVITPLQFGSSRGGILPTSIYDAWKPFSELSFTPRNRTDWNIIRSALRVPLRPGDRKYFKFSNTANYSPLGYMPQAIGIGAGRLFSLPPIILLYLGREANLLSWIGIVYASLRIIPMLRPAMFLLMLMPMSLSLAATVSLDTFTNAIGLFLAAYILRLAVPENLSERLRWSSILLLCLAMAASCVSKVAYTPLLALLLLIPRRRFGSAWRQAFILSGLAAFSLIVVFVWISQTGGTSVNLRPEIPSVNPTLQLEFLQHHPIAFLHTFWRSCKLNWLYMFVGSLGWTDVPLPHAFAIGYLLVLIGACYPRRNDPSPPAGWRLALVFCGVLTSFLVIGVLDYLVWTPVGSGDIEGIQGRYFIPFAPAVLLLLWSNFQLLPRSMKLSVAPWKIDLIAIAIAMTSCVWTVIIIHDRYFVT